MSGRKLIKKFKWLIQLINIFYKFIPKFILDIIWIISCPSEGRLSLFFRFLYVKKYTSVCGDNIFIGKYVTLKNIHSLKLMNDISVHAYCYIDAYGGIEIGNSVSIANHTTIVSFEHTWEASETPIKYNKVEPKQVKIENDVWIGSGCRILSGVLIHSRSIVAAGAVVNKDVPSNVIVGGIPCKVIKSI